MLRTFEKVMAVNSQYLPCALMYSAPLLCFLVALCLAVGPSSLAQVVLQPESLLSVDCPTQPYAALSGASGLLAAASGQPAFVATLGSSPILYASDVWGASQKPVPLRASLSPTANLAATNARLRGASTNGNSLFLVFSRDEGLGIASIPPDRWPLQRLSIVSGT